MHWLTCSSIISVTLFRFNNCFGVLGVLDRLHGTDLQFRASKQYQRHVMLLNSVPLNQQYPDTPKKKPE